MGSLVLTPCPVLLLAQLAQGQGNYICHHKPQSTLPPQPLPAEGAVPRRQAPRQLKPQSPCSLGLCKEPPYTASSEQSETHGSQGRRASGGHSPGWSGHLQKQLSHVSCAARGQESGRVGPLLSQDGKARVPDKRGVCQPPLPFNPTAECLFLTNNEMKVLCGC